MRFMSPPVFAFAFFAGGTLLAQNAASPTRQESQTITAASPSFEVATIKPSDPDHPNDCPEAMGHRVAMCHTSIRFLLGFAYDLQDQQIKDAPTWLNSEEFDLNAVSGTPGDPTLQQIKIMLQKLFADRLQLRFHRETRGMTAYVLTVAKGGPKLQASRKEPDGLPSLLMQPGFPRIAAMKAQNMSMPDFARLLQSGILDHPVIDQTGLKGTYEFLIRWTPDESQFTQAGVRIPPPSDTAEAPPLVTAMQEQLGLKLTA